MKTSIFSILFLFIFVTAEDTTNILLNCGGSSVLTDANNRSWSPDVKSKFLSYSGDSKTSPATTHNPYVLTVPYMSARIFTSPFTYSFPVTAGRKLVRLYFQPNSYGGLKATEAVFSVSLGSFRLLNNFKAIPTSQVMNYSSTVKEFLVNFEGGCLNVTFSPKSRENYAFINGIEVTSIRNIYSGGILTLVGSSAAVILDNSTALENLYRLNVGGEDLSSSQDPLYRHWKDDSSFYSERPDYTETGGPEMSLKYPKGTVEYMAPLDLYLTARSMTSNGERNRDHNLTWGFEVESGFKYMVRLHFCEVYMGNSHRIFSIYLNNKTAEANLDVVALAGGAGVPIHKDYLVESTLGKGKQFIWISLHPTAGNMTDYTDAFLNGIEIFKLNSSNGNFGSSPSVGPHVIDQRSRSKNRRVQRAIVGGGVCGGVILGGLIVGLVVGVYLRRSKKVGGDRGDQTSGCRHFTLSEINEATQNFESSRVIGVGGFGNVYRGEIDGQTTTVAIKRSNPLSAQGRPEFNAEIEMLSKLRHRHLVSLIGYCDENSEMILVYHYMARGTMRDHLYETQNSPLSWKTRLLLSVGAARGLHYLHTGANQAIIHRDVKTTNILLDENMVAKFSDFGLAKTGPTLDDTHVSTNVKGTHGYLDPEYLRRQTLTIKSDVYSFGVVLCEILCARRALNVTLPDEQVLLAEWAQYCYKKGRLEEILDPHLKGKIAPESFNKFAETAMKCLLDQSRERPTMGDVLWNLELALQLQENSEMDNASDAHEENAMNTGGIDVDALSLSEVFYQMVNPVQENSEVDNASDAHEENAMDTGIDMDALSLSAVFYQMVNPLQENSEMDKASDAHEENARDSMNTSITWMHSV